MKMVSFELMLLSLLLTPTWAGEPVYFADPELKAAVEDALWVLSPTPTDMLALTDLEYHGGHYQEHVISDLTGLEHAHNLQSLTLRFHRLENISALSGLTNLHTVILEEAHVTDISALSGLGNLRTLELRENQISDISALSGLTRLRRLSLHRNSVRDLAPLSDLTSLTWFDLRINPLNQEAYDIYIPLIIANNPGLWLVYDPTFQRHLSVSSTGGGSVVEPGQGTFAYEYGESVYLTAKADSCFAFVNWSGTFCASRNPFFLTMNQDYEVRANFVSTLSTIHVDDDAPNDPGPGNSSVSDPWENGTVSHPFDRVQEAINVAPDGIIVLVRPGIYRENIDLLGKRIALVGIDSMQAEPEPYPVLEGAGTGPVVRFVNGEGPDCLTRGFVITGGVDGPGAAITCRAASPTVANCLIVGNRSSDPDGAAIYCKNSHALLANCTIADNSGGKYSASLYALDSEIMLSNSILWNNEPAELLVNGTGHVSIHYTDIAGGWPGADNLDADPLFARAGSWADPNDPNAVLGPEDLRAVWTAGDYHLQSQAGRWDPQVQLWVQDPITSSCIDAGDPNDPVDAEPLPNGGLVNIGAYGGTRQATRSHEASDGQCSRI